MLEVGGRTALARGLAEGVSSGANCTGHRIADMSELQDGEVGASV